MRLSDWLTVLSVLLAPLIALQVQRWIEDYRRRMDRKQWIFRTLMTTRAETLSRDHVNALNMIDLEYHGDAKAESIRRVWREYLDHLGSFPNEGSDDQVQRWLDKKDDVLAELIFEMSKYLGYRFEKLMIRKAIYHPSAYSKIDSQQNTIRERVLEILSGTKSLPIAVTAIPFSEDDAREQSELRKLMLQQYKGEFALRIRVEQDSEAQKK
ncbi:MAG: hypothetical protein JST05_00895 [Acidobacteria bacterium]|nr:hypothetical protein [Acidobacteriota bacterium]